MNEHNRRHHGYTTAHPEGEPVPEPSFAERARTLLVQGAEGTLATQCRRHPGYPFASLMPYAVDANGRALVLVSALAVHTQNLQHDGRASLLVAEAGAGGRNPLGLARVTLVGRMHRLPSEEGGSTSGDPPAGDEEGGDRQGEPPPPLPAPDPVATRDLYLARHPEARYWIDYPDFGLRWMEVEDVYYVGGFGVMGWVGAEDYRKAAPDPLHDSAQAIIDHMNDDHADALVLLARSEGFTGVEEAHMTAVDRLGYHLRVRTTEGMRGHRIGFPAEAGTPQRVRELLVAQVREARARLAPG